MRCGGLGAALRRGAGVANQVILEPGTGQRAGDQTTDKQPYPCHEQRILLDGLKDSLSRPIRGIRRCAPYCPCSVHPGINNRTGGTTSGSGCAVRDVLNRGRGRTCEPATVVLETAGPVGKGCTSRRSAVLNPLGIRGDGGPCRVSQSPHLIGSTRNSRAYTVELFRRISPRGRSCVLHLFAQFASAARHIVRKIGGHVGSFLRGGLSCLGAREKYAGANHQHR